MDIRKFVRVVDTSQYDTVLFDGGESRTDYSEEKDKFYDLFHSGVLPAINSNTKGFILKILTPMDPRIIKDLEEIRKRTGCGNFYNCSYSRQSTMELYFVSTKPYRNLTKDVKDLIDAKLRKAEVNPGSNQPGPRLAPGGRQREEVIEDVKLLKPLNMDRSVKELGCRLFECGRNFLHWESLGVYAFGTKGGVNTVRVALVWSILRGISNSLTNYLNWGTTDTTPEGFERVFIRKVDTSPVENGHNFVRMEKIYNGMAKYFRMRGFKLTELGYDQVEVRCNKQGAGTVQDDVSSIGEYVSNPDWRKRVDEIRANITSGSPTKGVFNTMGKREKKIGGDKGSRMIAYLPIGMRLLELKIFGKLLELTKPFYNRFGVGGVGLHDFGMRMKDIFKEWSCSDDVAGFDTRVGLKLLSLEFYAFISNLGGNVTVTRTAEALYRLYAYPFLLIPMPSDYVRSELISGRGQRMSGTGPTYAMNTITRLAIAILQFSDVDNIALEDLIDYAFRVMAGKTKWAGLCSGDDFSATSDRDTVKKYSKTWGVLNAIGFYRKDIIKDVDTPINDNMLDTEFCSHKYERVSYYDDISGETVERVQPVRTYGEIFAKSTIWVSGNDVAEDQEAWTSAQGNNLLINYAHMRDCRRLGFALKSCTRQNIILNEKRKAGFLPRPWMREGQVLDILNSCLFGDSTAYPVPGFAVRKWSHVGYIPLNRETIFEPEFHSRQFVEWRKSLPFLVGRLRSSVSNTFDYMRYMTRYKPVF